MSGVVSMNDAVGQMQEAKTNALAMRGAIALNGRKQVSMAEIEKTANDFESMFLSQMLQHMFAGVDTDPTFGGGAGEDTFKSLLVDEYGKVVAKAGGIGIADHVKTELLRMQEVQ